MASGGPTEPLSPKSSARGKKSRTLLFAILGVVSAMLIALIILIVLLTSVLRRSDGPTPPDQAARSAGSSSSPSSAASPPSDTSSDASIPTSSTQTTPASSESPPATTSDGARFMSFTAPDVEPGCSMGGPGFDSTNPLVSVSWTTEGAEEAWFVQGTSDAADSGFMQLPVNGSAGDFPYESQFPCNAETATYTITLVGFDGEHVSRSWTVQNTGDIF